jgi:uncharacterized LabA/DUF88 family protein
MDKAKVFIDAGFLSKLSKHLGAGYYLKYNLFSFCKNLTGKEGLVFKGLNFYNAPPYQSQPPTKDERKRKENYDSFMDKLSRNRNVTIRQGRCRKLKENGKIKFSQKGVDTLLTMDLMELSMNKEKIKTVILIASDTDFVPIVKHLRQTGIRIVLYTYFERDRKSKFSTSNYLLQSVSNYKLLDKACFDECPLVDEPE